MENSIDIHDRIQSMIKSKLKGKKHLFSDPPKTKRQSKLNSHSIAYLPLQLRKSQAKTIQNISTCNKQLNIERYNTQLLQKANMIIKNRDINRQLTEPTQTYSYNIDSQKNIVQKILSKFQNIKDDSYLFQTRNKLESQRHAKSQVQYTLRESINVERLPIITNKSKDVIVFSRKRALPEWGSKVFQFNKQQKASSNQHMTAFIRQLDKQRLKHQNFRMKMLGQINKIENMKEQSFHEKNMGELYDIKNQQYKFHDIFLRCRKVKNHIKIQQI